MTILSGVSFLCPLKTSENLWFSDVFRGYKKGTPGSNGLKNIWDRFVHCVKRAWIWENTDQKKLCIWILFAQWWGRCLGLINHGLFTLSAACLGIGTLPVSTFFCRVYAKQSFSYIQWNFKGNTYLLVGVLIY